MHFNPEPGPFSLAIDTKYNFGNCVKFSLVMYICLTLISQLQFGLIGCMILMKECVSLTTAAMKIGKGHHYSDYSNNC